MIVVGVDVHKRSLTAVAVDEVGRPVAEQTVEEGQVLLGVGGVARARSGCGRWRTAGS